MDASDYQTIRQLFDDYLRMYASRDDRLTTYFSEDFSGFTGGGDFLVKDREEWVAITRQDFAQVKDPLRIELKDLAIQSLADTIAVTTGFFTIHLPIKDHVLSRETARLVLIFRKESAGWKIAHSSISIPYYLVREGEVYPLKELTDRNQILEELVAERTIQLAEANDNLQRTNEELAREIAEHKQDGVALQQSNQKIEAITSVLPDGIGILSLEGKIQFISDKLVEMHGYSTEQTDENLGRSVLDFIDPSNHKLLIDNIRKALAGESDDKLTEYLAVKKDNSRFDIDVNSTVLRDSNGNPTSILYVERDITERKRAEEALRESEKGYRELSIKLQDAYLWMSQKKDKIETRKYSESIIFLTAEDGQICGFTEKALGITKKSRSDLQGCNIQDILVFQEGQTFMDLIHKARQKMSHLTTLKFKNQLEDGPVYEAKLTRIFVESKGLFYIVLY
jgi:PAS domain S-box-containing protein